MGMTEIYDFLVKTNNLVVIGSALAAGLIFLAWKLSMFTPKEKLGSKVEDAQGDLVDGLHASYERQFDLLNSRITAMDTRILTQGDLIHRQQVRLTRLQVLIIQMKALLQAQGTPLPAYIQAEITALIESER